MSPARGAAARQYALDVSHPTISSRHLLACLLLVVVTATVYLPTLRFEFLNYDDDEYVSTNPFIQQGITMDSLRWAFTTERAGNWHPLTWISHMLDWRLYGARAGGHHITSVLLHIANTILLLVLLARMTGAPGRSALVAALFALHPLHVESVAWVAERKDVLSTFFWMLTMLAYLRYTRSPSVSRYVLVSAALFLGLMTKPMLVTLPLVLLLLDYWPLARFDRRQGGASGVRALGALVLEKLPLLALSAASSIITYVVQQGGGAVKSGALYPLPVRLGNAIATYMAYVLRMVWPSDLSIYYPHPGAALPAWKVAASTLALTLITALAVRERRKKPYLLVGWLWYLGALVPVIGLVQVGLQARADRYTYVPLIGLFIAVAWGTTDVVSLLARRWGVLSVEKADSPRALRSWTAAAGVVLLLLAACTRREVRHWRTTSTVFEHALDAVGENDLAHIHLGLALEDHGRRGEAIAHYRKAIRLDPDSAAHYHLASALAREGELEEALAAYRDAVRAEPRFETARYGLGTLLLARGRAEEAIEQFASALRINPGYAEAQFKWGMALSSLSRWAEAARHFEAAIGLDPRFAEAHYNLAVARFLMSDYRGAWAEVGLARRLGFAPAPRFLGMLAEKMPDPSAP